MLNFGRRKLTSTARIFNLNYKYQTRSFRMSDVANLNKDELTGEMVSKS